MGMAVPSRADLCSPLLNSQFPVTACFDQDENAFCFRVAKILEMSDYLLTVRGGVRISPQQFSLT
jgi:hypothetical protein